MNPLIHYARFILHGANDVLKNVHQLSMIRKEKYKKVSFSSTVKMIEYI